MTGAGKSACPPTMNYLFVDVCDLALAHVLAAEKPEAGGKRFFMVSGLFCNTQIAEMIGEEFEELRGNLPRECVVDTVRSLKAVEACQI